MRFLARTHRQTSNKMINTLHSEFDCSLGVGCVDGERDSTGWTEARAVRRISAQPSRHCSRVQPLRKIIPSGPRARGEADQDIEGLRGFPSEQLCIFNNFGQRLWILVVLDPELPPPVQVVRAESAVKQMSRDGPRDPLGAHSIAVSSKRPSPAKQVGRLHVAGQSPESVVVKAIVVNRIRQPGTEGCKSRIAIILWFARNELVAARLDYIERLLVENLVANGLACLEELAEGENEAWIPEASVPERPTPEELKEPSCHDSLALVGRYKHSCYILIRTQVRGLPGAGPTRVIVRLLPLFGFTAVPIRTVIPSLIVIIEIH